MPEKNTFESWWRAHESALTDAHWSPEGWTGTFHLLKQAFEAGAATVPAPEGAAA